MRMSAAAAGAGPDPSGGCPGELVMTKIDEVRSAMMAALKAGDKPQKEALSLLLSALKAKAIDKRADLTEEEENAVVYREIKEAKETLESTPADRADIIAECESRIAAWTPFAPQRLSDEEVRSGIRDFLAEQGIEHPTPKDMGRLMKPLLAYFQGRAEGGTVSRILKEFMS